MEKHFYSQQELDFLARNMYDYDYAVLASMFTEEFGVPMSKSKVNNAIKSHKLGRKIAEVSHWTDAMISYLKENYMSMEIPALAESINALFGTSITASSVSHKMRVIGLKKNDYQAYSSEEDAWIVENYRKYSMSKLAEEFSKLFRPVTDRSITMHTLHTLNLRKDTMHKYTTEEDEWLKENFVSYSQSALTHRFNERFSCNVSNGPLVTHCRCSLNLKKDNQHKYSEEESSYLRELNEAGMRYSDMIPLFEERFGFKPTVNSLKIHARKIGFCKEKHESFTQEQDKWLAENAPLFTNYVDCATAFNNKFGTSKTDRGIQSHCVRYLGFVSGRQGIKKGSTPWCTLEKYHESTLKSGYTYIKLDNGNWIPKQQYIWEHANGKLKDGEFVVFLNKDTTDFRLENLAVINRKSHSAMCLRGWYSDNAEFTKTGILECELEQHLKKWRKSQHEQNP